MPYHMANDMVWDRVVAVGVVSEQHDLSYDSLTGFLSTFSQGLMVGAHRDKYCVRFIKAGSHSLSVIRFIK